MFFCFYKKRVSLSAAEKQRKIRQIFDKRSHCDDVSDALVTKLEQEGDRSHGASDFILELLQNAHDASPEDGQVCVEIRFASDLFIFSHTGVPFSEKDVDGVCGVGISSEKRDNSGKIGCLGLGFKTVLAVAPSHTHIVSDGWSFGFSKRVSTGDVDDTVLSKKLTQMHQEQSGCYSFPWHMMPVWMDPNEVYSESGIAAQTLRDKPDYTHIIAKTDSKHREEIRQKLTELCSDLNWLLMLNRFSKITVIIGKESYTLRREIVSLSTTSIKFSDRVSSQLKTVFLDEVSLFVGEEVKSVVDIYRCLFSVNPTVQKQLNALPDYVVPARMKTKTKEEVKETEIRIAFEKQDGSYVPAASPIMYSALPTGADLGFYAHVNADFFLDISRQSLHKSNFFNVFLLENLSKFYLGLLTNFSNHPQYRFCVLSLIPAYSPQSKDVLKQSVFNPVRNISDLPIFPGVSGPVNGKRLVLDESGFLEFVFLSHQEFGFLSVPLDAFRENFGKNLARLETVIKGCYLYPNVREDSLNRFPKQVVALRHADKKCTGKTDVHGMVSVIRQMSADADYEDPFLVDLSLTWLMFVYHHFPESNLPCLLSETGDYVAVSDALIDVSDSDRELLSVFGLERFCIREEVVHFVSEHDIFSGQIRRCRAEDIIVRNVKNISSRKPEDHPNILERISGSSNLNPELLTTLGGLCVFARDGSLKAVRDLYYPNDSLAGILDPDCFIDLSKIRFDSSFLFRIGAKRDLCLSYDDEYGISDFMTLAENSTFSDWWETFISDLRSIIRVDVSKVNINSGQFREKLFWVEGLEAMNRGEFQRILGRILYSNRDLLLENREVTLVFPAVKPRKKLSEKRSGSQAVPDFEIKVIQPFLHFLRFWIQQWNIEHHSGKPLVGSRIMELSGEEMVLPDLLKGIDLGDAFESFFGITSVLSMDRFSGLFNGISRQEEDDPQVIQFRVSQIYGELIRTILKTPDFAQTPFDTSVQVLTCSGHFRPMRDCVFVDCMDAFHSFEQSHGEYMLYIPVLDRDEINVLSEFFAANRLICVARNNLQVVSRESSKSTIQSEIYEAVAKTALISEVTSGHSSEDVVKELIFVISELRIVESEALHVATEIPDRENWIVPVDYFLSEDGTFYIRENQPHHSEAFRKLKSFIGACVKDSSVSKNLRRFLGHKEDGYTRRLFQSKIGKLNELKALCKKVCTKDVEMAQEPDDDLLGNRRRRFSQLDEEEDAPNPPLEPPEKRARNVDAVPDTGLQQIGTQEGAEADVTKVSLAYTPDVVQRLINMIQNPRSLASFQSEADLVRSGSSSGPMRSSAPTDNQKKTGRDGEILGAQFLLMQLYITHSGKLADQLTSEDFEHLEFRETTVNLGGRDLAILQGQFRMGGVSVSVDWINGVQEQRLEYDIRVRIYTEQPNQSEQIIYYDIKATSNKRVPNGFNKYADNFRISPNEFSFMAQHPNDYKIIKFYLESHEVLIIDSPWAEFNAGQLFLLEPIQLMIPYSVTNARLRELMTFSNHPDAKVRLSGEVSKVKSLTLTDTRTKKVFYHAPASFQEAVATGVFKLSDRTEMFHEVG